MCSSLRRTELERQRCSISVPHMAWSGSVSVIAAACSVEQDADVATPRGERAAHATSLRCAQRSRSQGPDASGYSVLTRTALSRVPLRARTCSRSRADGQAGAPCSTRAGHVQPVAADRTAPGPGGEARSLHRHGAGQPAAGAPAAAGSAFLLIYPDTYEIGLPNQGLQILYEILNERDDAVAERAYAPVDRHGGVDAARRGVPLFCVDTHRAAARLRRARLQPLGRARLHEPAQPASTSPGVPVRNEDRGPTDPLVIAGGHCTYNPEPLADYVDAFVIGDGEEVDRRDRRGRRRVEARRSGDRAKRCCATSRRSPASTSRRCTTSSTTARALARDHAALSRRARGRRQAHGRRPRRLAVPEAAARAARRGRARPAQRRDLPRLHPRLPLLPGRA